MARPGVPAPSPDALPKRGALEHGSIGGEALGNVETPGHLRVFYRKDTPRRQAGAKEDWGALRDKAAKSDMRHVLVWVDFQVGLPLRRENPLSFLSRACRRQHQPEVGRGRLRVRVHSRFLRRRSGLPVWGDVARVARLRVRGCQPSQIRQRPNEPHESPAKPSDELCSKAAGRDCEVRREISIQHGGRRGSRGRVAGHFAGALERRRHMI
mmetsp:Transcript_11022/g.29130  ORF Transcript_11022/g.29130 Transcript_11022/m.29130 type:complete len:211 (-) Transcript_11022:111-743(-)